MQEIHSHLTKHGDGVKDVAFEVENVHVIYRNAIVKGAGSVQDPITLRDNDEGEVVLAVLKTFGDTTHTLVDRSKYRGVFLPGYRPVMSKDPVNDYLPKISVEVIDHCVGNQDWNQLEPAAK